MTDFYDPAELRRFRARRKAQRVYSDAYRDKLKAQKAPDRDDVAAAALRVFLALAAQDTKSVGKQPGLIASDLQRAGFDRAEAVAKLRAMVRRTIIKNGVGEG